MTTKIRISPRIAVIASALSSELGRVEVLSPQPSLVEAALKLASVGQLQHLSTETVRGARSQYAASTFALTDTHDQVLFREQHTLYLDLQVAYRLLARALQKEQPKAEATHRKVIARLHAEQEALNAADKARRAPSRAA
jgi:hypothetical protein